MQSRVPETGETSSRPRLIRRSGSTPGIASCWRADCVHDECRIKALAWGSVRSQTQDALAIKGSAALPVGELIGVFVPFGLTQFDVGGNDIFAQALPEHA